MDPLQITDPAKNKSKILIRHLRFVQVLIFLHFVFVNVTTTKTMTIVLNYKHFYLLPLKRSTRVDTLAFACFVLRLQLKWVKIGTVEKKLRFWLRPSLLLCSDWPIDCQNNLFWLVQRKLQILIGWGQTFQLLINWKPFARCYVPCGAPKFISLQPLFRSVKDFSFLITLPRPLSLLCWGDNGSSKMWISTLLKYIPADTYNSRYSQRYSQKKLTWDLEV